MTDIDRDALKILRHLLDSEPADRATQIAALSTDPAVTSRVQELLARVDDDEALLSSAQADDVEGLEIGPYRVLERIGRGGMGEVFLAERSDGAWDRKVAVKRIGGGFTQLDARFLRERRVLARLHHPHIAQLLDGGVTAQGQPWFAMDYVRGDTITAWCDTRRADLHARVALLRQVCDAVQFAHGHLVVHRDIKPANVLVGDDGNAKLLDFGIAKLLDEGDPTQTQTHVMTPAWAAPEQRRGEPVGTASDVYQLGLLLRCLLVGTRPASSARASTQEAPRVTAHWDTLPAEDAAELAHARGTTASGLRTQLRGDLECIVARATADAPGDRYASPLALSEDLGRWMQGLPVDARRGDRGYRLRRLARRHWPALAASIALLGLASVFGTLHVVRLDRELQRTERERAKAQAVSDYFYSLFDNQDPARTENPDVTAAQLLETSVANIAALDHVPESKAIMLLAAGRALNLVGRYAEAQVALERALAVFRTVQPAYRNELAGTYVELAMSRNRQGDAAAATGLVERALPLIDERTPRAQRITALQAHVNYAGDARGADWSKARYRDIVELTRNPATAADCNSHVGALVNIGTTERQDKQLHEARASFKRGLDAGAMCKASPQTTLVARHYLSATLLDLQDYAAADAIQRTLAPDADAYFARDDTWRGILLTTRAINHLLQGRERETGIALAEAERVYTANGHAPDFPSLRSVRIVRAYSQLESRPWADSIGELEAILATSTSTSPAKQTVLRAALAYARCRQAPSQAALDAYRERATAAAGEAQWTRLYARWESACSTAVSNA